MAERALATAFVNIVPGTKDLEAYLKGQLGAQVGAAGAPAGGMLAGGVATGFGSKFKSAFMPVLGTMGVAFGAVGIANFAKDMYSSAVEGQKVDAVLTQVTDSMGLFGTEQGKVVSRLQDYATEMMKRTGIDDDVIKSTQAQLMSFKDLAASADTAGGMFDRATTVAADMAAVFGGDASSHAVKLGKALNDPVGGIASLSRVGVQFTDDQKAMIEGMVAAGDVAGAQALIMEELETQVGGTAEASATAGEKMSARWDEAVQNLGTTLMPVFEGIVGYIGDTIVPAFEDAADGVRLFLGWFGDNQGWLIPVISGVAGALAALAVYTSAVGIAAAIAAAGGLPAIITATWLWTAALLANPVTWIIIGIGLLIGALVLLAMNWEAVSEWVTGVWEDFIAWTHESNDAFAKWFEDLWAGIGQFFSDIFEAMGQIAEDIWSGIAKFFEDTGKNISNWWEGFWTGLVRFFEDVFSGIGRFIGDVFRNVANGIIGVINFLIRGINGFIDVINIALMGINAMTGSSFKISRISEIPKLAKGGFVDSPTLAMIGEAGPEVVTPLKDFERMMGIGNGGGKTVNYYAAPNESLSSEQALFNAMNRAKVVAGW
jgi:hypothetical protein